MNELLTRYGPMAGLFGVVIAILSFVFSQCSGTERVETAYPGSVEVDRVVDTVVRIVDRPPIRVAISQAPQITAPAVVVTDTVWITPDSAVIDTAIQQGFAAHTDTIVGRDTIRVRDSIVVRAARGPISIAQLRTSVEFARPPDSLMDYQSQIIIRNTEFRDRPWLETVGIGTVGAAGGILVYIIAKELLRKE